MTVAFLYGTNDGLRRPVKMIGKTVKGTYVELASQAPLQTQRLARKRAMFRASLRPVTAAVSWKDAQPADATHLTLKTDDVVLLAADGAHEAKADRWGTSGKLWSGHLQKDHGAGGKESEDKPFTAEGVLPLAEPFGAASVRDMPADELAKLTGPNRQQWPLALALRTKQIANLNGIDALHSGDGGTEDGSTAADAVVCCDLRNNRLCGEGQQLQSLECLPHLVHLDLGLNHLGPSIQSLPQLPRLRALNLSHNELSMFSPPNWEADNLVVLNLSSNNLSALDLTALTLPLLARLNLSNNRLCSLVGLRKLKALTDLDASRNGLNAMAVQPLALLRRLYKLELAENRIADCGVAAEALVALPELRFLSLVDNVCTEDRDYRMSMLQIGSLQQLDYGKVTEFSRRQLMKAMGAESMEEAAVIHKIVGRTTTEYLSRIEFERRRTEERLVAAAHSNEAVRSAFSKYAGQMEEELQSLVRFVLRKDQDHALPRTPRTAARILETLRVELDNAEATRKKEAEAAAESAQHSLAANVASTATDNISQAEAMRQLAKSKPKVWLRLKEQEAQLLAEHAAMEANDPDVQLQLRAMVEAAEKASVTANSEENPGAAKAATEVALAEQTLALATAYGNPEEQTEEVGTRPISTTTRNAASLLPPLRTRIRYALTRALTR